MSHKAIRTTIIGLETFVVPMAIYGSVSMLTDATGFGLKEVWLRGSPFSNYQIPAVGLLVGVGGSSFLAALAPGCPTDAHAQRDLAGLLGRSSPFPAEDYLAARLVSPGTRQGVMGPGRTVVRLQRRLCEITEPTLVIAARRDPQMPPACAEELAA